MIPSIQARRLHRSARSSDDTVRAPVPQEGIEEAFERLWIAAAGDKYEIPSFWDPRVVMVISEELGGEEPASEWEMPAPRVTFLSPRSW